MQINLRKAWIHLTTPQLLINSRIDLYLSWATYLEGKLNLNHLHITCKLTLCHIFHLAERLGKYIDKYNDALSMRLRICWLYPLKRGKTLPPSKEGGPRYDTKTHLIMRFQFCDLGSVEYLCRDLFTKVNRLDYLHP